MAFASTYHLELSQIRTMSWRRFRVLFQGVFSWSEPGQASAERIADTVQWDSLQHVEVPDLMEAFQVERIPVGGTDDG